MNETWETQAKAKRDSINKSIPEEWRLSSPIPSAEQQRDVTGSFICQYLSKHEIDITETDAVGIVQKTTTGQWSAAGVAEAFCHRASLAHQLVRILYLSFTDSAMSYMI